MSPEGWRRDFDIADEDEDGYISESEGKDTWGMKSMVDVMDVDGDGQIDFGEVEAYLKSL